jgi:hypothetical protein
LDVSSCNEGRASLLNWTGKMTEVKDLPTTTLKARTINLDESRYGIFAEIGAGQEVAREFFHAGGASGSALRRGGWYDRSTGGKVCG